MGKTSESLRQVLEDYSIRHSQLAQAIGFPESMLSQWLQGHLDLPADTIPTIVETLRSLNGHAADDFLRLYLGQSPQTGNHVLPLLSKQQLPASEQVNVAALAGLFGNFTNSYKYLFFLSLLDILKRRQFEVLAPISFQALIVEMLANAWFPHTFFKLSFGTQDKIAQKLDSLDLVIEQPIIQFRDTDKKLLRQAISAQNLKDIVSDLSRYVPFRLLAPFVEGELQGVNRGKGSELEKAMPEIADRCFETCKPLYRFDATQQKDCQVIIVHPDWAKYLEQHYAIVRGWAAWEWLNYMQKRNPTTPAIASKLFMPTKRDSLSDQTKYWKSVLRHQPLNCIYSKRAINPDKFSLDHYLPWSFVAHDQLWNLIPTLPEVNSAKSNHIPSQDYFAQFVELQYQGLTISHAALPEDKWQKQVENFINDFKLSSSEDLLDLQKLCNLYERELIPQVALAVNNGFSPDWRYVA